MLWLAVFLATACTSVGSLDASEETDPVEQEPDDATGDDETGGEQQSDADGTGDTDGTVDSDPDELTFTVENPEDVFDPEDIPEVPMPALATPDQQLPELDSHVAEAIADAVASSDIAILDVAGVLDDGPTAAEIASFRDGNTRSGTGELIVLDQRASLACANVEIALSNLDEGDVAAAANQARTAADRSRLSKLSEIRQWSAALEASVVESDDRVEAVDAPILVGFLSVCVDGGHSL